MKRKENAPQDPKKDLNSGLKKGLKSESPRPGSRSKAKPEAASSDSAAKPVPKSRPSRTARNPKKLDSLDSPEKRSVKRSEKRPAASDPTGRGKKVKKKVSRLKATSTGEDPKLKEAAKVFQNPESKSNDLPKVKKTKVRVVKKRVKKVIPEAKTSEEPQQLPTPTSVEVVKASSASSGSARSTKPEILPPEPESQITAGVSYSPEEQPAQEEQPVYRQPKNRLSAKQESAYSSSNSAPPASATPYGTDSSNRLPPWEEQRPREPQARRSRLSRTQRRFFLKTIYKYIGIEVLRIFVMSVMVISLIGSVLLAFQLTRNGIRIGYLWPILQKSLAYPLFFSIPVSLLFGITLGVGRMAHELEISALKASGVSFRQLSAPILIFAALLTGISFYINGTLIPQIHYEKGNLREAIIEQLQSLGKGRNRSLLLPGRVRLFVEQYDRSKFRGIKLDLEEKILRRLKSKFQTGLLGPMGNKGPNSTLTLLADRCDLVVSPDGEQVYLNLKKVEILVPEWSKGPSLEPEVFRQKYSIKSFRLPLSFLEKGERLKDRSWGELFTEISDLSTRKSEVATELDKLNSSSPSAENLGNSDFSPDDQRVRKALLNREFEELTKSNNKAHTELHRRAAFSLASFSFAFLACPLVLLTERRGRLWSFFIGNIFVVLPFFLLLMLGIFLGERGIYPGLTLGLANLVPLGIGFVLWSKVRRPR